MNDILSMLAASASCFLLYSLLHELLFRLAVLLHGPDYLGEWLPFRDRLALARRVRDTISCIADLSTRFRGPLYAVAVLDAVLAYLLMYCGWLFLAFALARACLPKAFGCNQ